MRRLQSIFAVLLLVSFGPGLAGTARAQPPQSYKSPLGLAVDQKGQHAYVALHTAGTVAVVDVPAGKVLKEWPVGQGPHDLVLVKGKLYVTCEYDDTLVVLDAASGQLQARHKVGQAPQAVAVLDQAGKILVTCREESALYAVDVKTGKVESLAVPGWPSRLIPVEDASGPPSVLVLSGQPGKAILNQVHVGDTLSVGDSSTLNGVSNAHSLALQNVFGAGVLVAHQRPRTKISATQVAQNWVFANELTTVSMAGQLPAVPETSALLDVPSRGHADPGDVVSDATRKLIFVCCAGSDEVLALKGEKVFFYKGNSLPLYIPAAGKMNQPMDMTLGRLFTLAHLKTGANPRRLALSGDGKTLVVANYLGDSLTVIDMGTLKVQRTISLQGPPSDAARRGAMLFHSARLTEFGQFTCASCHPNGGSDGLNWDLARDGIGNFVNTRPLWGVKDTAPYGWHGTSPTLADRVTGTLVNLHGYEPTKEEVTDLVAYLQSLAPPRPLPGKLLDQDKAARGQGLFLGKGGCVGCHSGPTYQDGKTHDVGTARPQDLAAKFDTPSLRGVAYTAPYLHDGRAATLSDIFTDHNPQHLHGKAHTLTGGELADVVEYLKTL